MSDFEKGKICGYGEAIAEIREAVEETGAENDSERTVKGSQRHAGRT